MTSLPNRILRRAMLALMCLAAPLAVAAQPTGQIRIAIGIDPDTLDPNTNALPIGNAIDLLVLNGLYRLGATNNIEPDLATGYAYSADGKVLTVKMVTGRRFSNGDPLNAEAVAASFNRLLDASTGSVYAGLYASLGKAVAVGEDTVEFHLTEPNGHALMLLANTAASIVNIAAVRRMGAQYGRRPVGSGPYVVKDYIGGERISLVPNTAYNGPSPARLRQIEFIVVPEDGSRMAMLETGEVDIVERVPPEAIPAIQALRNAEVLFLPSMFSINMEMVLRGPLTDARVRRALNISVDREGITRAVLGGLGTPSVGMVGPGTQDDLRRTFAPLPYDPDQAKALLREAGYGPGQLSLTMTCPTGRYIKDVQVCQALQGLWQAIGINMRANIVDRGTWTNVVSTPPDNRRDNMGMVGRATAGIDYTLYRLFYTGVGANRTGFSNPRVDELLRLGRATTDLERQKQIYGEVQQIIWDEEPFVFLWYQKQALGVSKAVKGFEVRPDETMLFWNIAVQR
ncbi:MAG: hypothetical protein IT556_13360 [Acetobacteraceae bacterium]|nr:hypothetical protein [Acetobacteraceae bacterium]